MSARIENFAANLLRLPPSKRHDRVTLKLRLLGRRFIKPLLSLFATLFGLLLLTFLIGRALPIDPVLAVVGEHATADVYEEAKQRMGLDRPLPVQFLRYLENIAHGDFGTSVASGKPVLHDLVQFFPATFELATAAMAIGLLLGIPAGIWAAVRRDRWEDMFVRLSGLGAYSVPMFWLGLLGLSIFYAKLGWVSGPGRIDTAFEYDVIPRTGIALVDAAMSGSWDAFCNVFSHLTLPALVLGLHTAAYLSRMTRGLMLESLSSEYVIAARMKGLSEFRVVCSHAFGNIRVPLLTSAAMSYTHLLEGAVLIETVFAWPGLGLYVTQSLFSADLPAVLGATTLIGIFCVFMNRLVDWLYPFLDPRTQKR